MSETKGYDFEESLQKLETIVTALERGNLSLDESLVQFERGIALTRECQQALTAAEQRVQLLIKNQDGSASTQDFDSGNDN